VYLFWGASFLAVREVVAVAPPFLASGFRFVIAGTVLIIWSRFLGAVWPAPAELRSTAMLGLVMFSINYACLFWAEQTVASGYAAIIASTIPVWIFIGEWLILGTLKPNAMAIAGILLGISGVTVLVLPTGGSRLTFAAVALLVGAICWSGGTIWSRRLPLPRSRHASAGLQMAFGGAFQLVFAWAMSEYGRLPDAMAHWNWRLTLDMVYLIAAASIAAFLAFVWLIDHEPASRVASHAYVNPLIAVILGALVAGERFAGIQFLGAALVLSGVVVTLSGRRRGAKG
jgi:drug/metabolite transporter (DMT)-like permease